MGQLDLHRLRFGLRGCLSGGHGLARSPFRNSYESYRYVSGPEPAGFESMRLPVGAHIILSWQGREPQRLSPCGSFSLGNERDRTSTLQGRMCPEPDNFRNRKPSTSTLARQTRADSHESFKGGYLYPTGLQTRKEENPCCILKRYNSASLYGWRGFEAGKKLLGPGCFDMKNPKFASRSNTDGAGFDSLWRTSKRE